MGHFAVCRTFVGCIDSVELHFSSYYLSLIWPGPAVCELGLRGILIGRFAFSGKSTVASTNCEVKSSLSVSIAFLFCFFVWHQSGNWRIG